MSSLNGVQLTELELTIPPAGGWVATCRLESGTAPAPGPGTFVIGDLTLVGKILPGRGGEDEPAHPAVVVTAGSGWKTPLPDGTYSSPSNVRLRTVLGDLVRVAGELLDMPTDVSLGLSYGWTAGPPVDVVLADLFARGVVPAPWRVQPNGRTAFTPWPTLGAADAKGQITDRRLARGVREVALTTQVAAWLPGATVQGVTIRRVSFHENQEELRALVWES